MSFYRPSVGLTGFFLLAAAVLAAGMGVRPITASAQPASGIIRHVAGEKLFGDGTGFTWGTTAGSFVMARTADGARSWALVDLGSIAIDVATLSPGMTNAPPGVFVHFPDPDHGWIVWSTGRSMLHIASTADGGAHWRETLSISTDAVLTDELYPAPGSAVLLAQMPEGMMHTTMVTIVTHDNGVTWTASPLPYRGDGVAGWTFRNAKDGFISVTYPPGTSILLYRTTDGGKLWERIDLPLPPGLSVELVDGTFPGTPVFSGADRLDGRLPVEIGLGTGMTSFIYRTTDGGATWLPSGPTPPRR